MKKITPSGTRTFCTSSPLGRIEDEMISPIGSGSMATSSRAVAMACDPRGRQPQPVDGASVRPKPGAASRSCWLAADQRRRLLDAAACSTVAEPLLLLRRR